MKFSIHLRALLCVSLCGLAQASEQNIWMVDFKRNRIEFEENVLKNLPWSYTGVSAQPLYAYLFYRFNEGNGTIFAPITIKAGLFSSEKKVDDPTEVAAIWLKDTYHCSVEAITKTSKLNISGSPTAKSAEQYLANGILDFLMSSQNKNVYLNYVALQIQKNTGYKANDAITNATMPKKEAFLDAFNWEKVDKEKFSENMLKGTLFETYKLEKEVKEKVKPTIKESIYNYKPQEKEEIKEPEKNIEEQKKKEQIELFKQKQQKDLEEINKKLEDEKKKLEEATKKLEVKTETVIKTEKQINPQEETKTIKKPEKKKEETTKSIIEFKNTSQPEILEKLTQKQKQGLTKKPRTKKTPVSDLLKQIEELQQSTSSEDKNFSDDLTTLSEDLKKKKDADPAFIILRDQYTKIKPLNANIKIRKLLAKMFTNSIKETWEEARKEDTDIERKKFLRQKLQEAGIDPDKQLPTEYTTITEPIKIEEKKSEQELKNTGEQTKPIEIKIIEEKKPEEVKKQQKEKIKINLISNDSGEIKLTVDLKTQQETLLFSNLKTAYETYQKNQTSESKESLRKAFNATTDNPNFDMKHIEEKKDLDIFMYASKILDTVFDDFARALNEIPQD